MGNWSFASDTNKNIGGGTSYAGNNNNDDDDWFDNDDWFTDDTWSDDDSEYDAEVTSFTPAPAQSNGDPRGDEGNLYTNYTNPPPTVTPDPPANDPDPAPSLPDNTNTGLSDEDKAWLSGWSNTVTENMDANYNLISGNASAISDGSNALNDMGGRVTQNTTDISGNQTSFQNSIDGLTGTVSDNQKDAAKGIDANADSIGSNEKSIDANADSIGDNAKGVDANQDGIADNAQGLTAANQDISSAQDSVKSLSDYTKEELAQVDRGLLAATQSQEAGQKSDAEARSTIEQAAENEATRVDQGLADANTAVTDLDEATQDSFDSTMDTINEVSEDLSQQGIDLSASVTQAKESLSEELQSALEVEEHARQDAVRAIYSYTDGEISSIDEYYEAVASGLIEADGNILGKLEGYNTAAIKAGNILNEEIIAEREGRVEADTQTQLDLEQQINDEAEYLSNAIAAGDDAQQSLLNQQSINIEDDFDKMTEGFDDYIDAVSTQLLGIEAQQSEDAASNTAADEAREKAIYDEITQSDKKQATALSDTSSDLSSKIKEAEANLAYAITDGDKAAINKAASELITLEQQLTKVNSSQDAADEAREKAIYDEIEQTATTTLASATDSDNAREQAIYDELEQAQTALSQAIDNGDTKAMAASGQAVVDLEQRIAQEQEYLSNAIVAGDTANADQASKMGTDWGKRFADETAYLSNEIAAVDENNQAAIDEVLGRTDTLAAEAKSNTLTQEDIDQIVSEKLSGQQPADAVTPESEDTSVVSASEKETEVDPKELAKTQYTQAYWANRRQELIDSGMTADQAGAALGAEVVALGKSEKGQWNAYSQDQVNVATTDEQVAKLRDALGEHFPQGTEAEQAAELANLIKLSVETGLGTVLTTDTSGLFDETTTQQIKMQDGTIVTAVTYDPTVTLPEELGGSSFAMGDKTVTYYVDGVEVVTSTTDNWSGETAATFTEDSIDGRGNSISDHGDYGDSATPIDLTANNGGEGNSPANTGAQAPSEEPEADEEGGVAGVDLPMPDSLTDPESTGAYGQDGNAFTLDGVSFWKRVKDRNGRWVYQKVENYEPRRNQGRSLGWGNAISI